MRIASRASLSLAAAAGLAFCAFGASDGYLSFEDDTARTIVFGNRRVYVFTNASAAVTLTAQRDLTLEEFLVVGGGGGGGNTVGAGGGGGGVIYTNKAAFVTAESEIVVTVGAGGGAGSAGYKRGFQGGHSSFSINSGTFATAYGGGGGGGFSETTPSTAGNSGEIGSGGGSAKSGSVGTIGNNWQQGLSGAVGNDNSSISEKSCGGGGGGAGTSGSGRTGGEGLAFALTGETVVYGSGGGGGSRPNATAGKGGTNAGDGGQGMSTGYKDEKRGGFGVDGMGGGGGGGCFSSNSSPFGGNGGCGTVILVFTAGDHAEKDRFAILPIPEQVYFGEAVRPRVTVTNLTGSVLTEGADYTVSYSGNECAGEGVAIATGNEGTPYAGFSAMCVFRIFPAAIDDGAVAVSDETAVRVERGARIAYVFTNVAETAVLRVHQLLTLDEVLVVGGGGAGGNTIAGGGGGGGVVHVDTPRLVAAGSVFRLSVGAGGRPYSPAGVQCPSGLSGERTTLTQEGETPVVAYGGGGGAGFTTKKPQDAAVEGEIGSGGGASNGGSIGTENVNWSPQQGNPGATQSDPRAGGGGGAGSAAKLSAGGEGLSFDISGNEVVYGSGGGAGARNAGYEGAGGTNAGNGSGSGAGGKGVDGTGGGGGGGFTNYNGGSGGCGTVVLLFSVGDHVTDRFAVDPIPTQMLVGDEVRPSVRVTTPSGQVLTEGTDYTVSYEQNDRAGLGRVIVLGADGSAYEGFSFDREFEIIALAFADGNLAISDGSVRVVELEGRTAYVFTNASALVRLAVRQLVTLEEYLVVGGGGAGGNAIAGGGGGGGVLHAKPIQLLDAGQVLELSVGAGGRTQGGTYDSGLQGGSSTLSVGDLSVTAYGGGGGAGFSYGLATADPLGTIGSGGGSSKSRTAGTKNSQWAQGNPGGVGNDNDGVDEKSFGGGGGGAGAAGNGRTGGEGQSFDITGEPIVYGSGGGGGTRPNSTPGAGGTNAGAGALGGSGDRGGNGADGTGAGGGGGGFDGKATSRGGEGGCGTVILLVSSGDHLSDQFRIAEIPDQTYVGKPVVPKLTVTNLFGKVLSPGSDYTVSFADNEAPGVGTVTVVGRENTQYAGHRETANFNILTSSYDEYVACSDLTVRRIDEGGGRIVYVLTNTAERATLELLQNMTLVEYLVVGGGGAGGNTIGGGGGGGGIVHAEMRTVLPAGETLEVAVGAGGTTRTTAGRYQNGRSGGASSFGFGTTLVTAYGGGGGGGFGFSPEGDANGWIGSGGGATSSAGVGIEGVNWNPDLLGHKGGTGSSNVGGGGGGAGTAASGKTGGEGKTYALTGGDVVYGSGGGGGSRSGSTPGGGGTNGGAGAQGSSAAKPTTFPGKGVDGTGGGGGGGGYGTGDAFNYNPDYDGGVGGCGTVILVFEPGGEIGQPKVGAIGIDFPDGHTQPLVSATITGEKDGMTFLAEVVVRARIGDGDWLDTRTFTDVTNGQTIAFLASFAAQPGEEVSVEVAVTAVGATSAFEMTEAKAVGTCPESYGKGGGAGVIHVNPAATGRNDGSDWFNAMTDFRAAVASLSAEKPELWMAGGETLSTVQPATIAPEVEVTLRGGFAGVETNAADRVAGGYSTMDGGNLFDPFVIANDAALTMDGFKVVRAKQSAIKKTKGGDLTVVNCVLDNNGGTTAEASGRAVMVTGTAATTLRLKDLVVTRNFGSGAWHPGLAVCLETLKAAIIENCLFLTNGIQFSAVRHRDSNPGRNDATRGATLYAKDAPLTVGNCRFSASRGAGVTAAGGIIWIEGSCGASSFKNCVFTGNESVFPIDTYSATYPGRKTGTLVLSATAGTLDVENCTFAWNLAEAGRGATGVEVAGGTANVKNCIFHGGVVGTNNVAGVDIDVMAGGTANVSYCLFDADDGLRLGCEEGGTLNPQAQTFRYGDARFMTELDVMALVQTNRVAKTAQISFADNTEGAFVSADVHERRRSAAIDAGDVSSPYANEPVPNGFRVNLGAYGNTSEAAKSPDGSVLIVR